ncbi:efflux RND transporter periplasmic adaptor subunit [Phycicoccus endophyticus]|uniref:efflux RND transporter periplasmic adaptor subunit n=1 Tax=Phycicoccus endophyticus TaxID=1690220 RepID=UPI0019A05909|nr:HlyD family efflux transporter periplasmic adaptor subunit [Phycicoccus endophyticus]GGL34384.1 hypothetical protein GCM10012283_15990 [Phycicoccus endophyticus]
MSDCVAALTAVLSATDRAGSTLDRLADMLAAASTALQEQQSTAALQETPTTGAGTSGTSAGPAASGGTTGSTGVTPSTPGDTTGSAGDTSTGGVGATTGSGAATTAGSTAELEVKVLEATQELASAQQDLDGATLRAPISGRVASLDFVVGEQASTSAQAVIVGQGAALVTVDVPLAQLGMVRVAQPVEVTPAGTTSTVDGAVQSIGVLPTSTTASTPTYPVTVAVSRAPVTLATGSTASAGITLAEAEGVLTVPVSALSGLSSGEGSVQVVDGDAVSTTRVSVGAVGQGRAEVSEGLSSGQVVVLADPSQELPSSDSSSSGFGGGSGLGGGAPSGFGGGTSGFGGPGGGFGG